MIHVDITINGGNSPSKPSIAEVAFEALKQAPEFRINPPAAVALYPDYLEQLAKALSDDFSKIVTLKTLMEAKAQSLEVGLSTGLIAKLIPIMMKEQGGFSENEIAETATDFVEELPKVLIALKEFISGIPDLLRSEGITEEQIMRSPKVGLNNEMYKRYQAGELTIGELFVLQPAVIILDQN